MGENNIIAGDLMVQEVAGIRGDQTLGEAMNALVDLQQDKEIPDALVVLDESGQYQGVLTARMLCKSLAKSPACDGEARTPLGTRQLLELVQERSHTRVDDALVPDLPTVAPGERLLSLIRLASDQRAEHLPVLDNGKVRGLVPVTRIFLAAAALVLRPEDEGIHFDRDTSTGP